MQKFILSIVVLLALSTFTSCDKSDSLDEKVIQGQWYVADIRGDYSVTNTIDAETENYIIRYFMGDYLNFRMGEGVFFSDENELIIRQLDDRLFRFDYEWKDETLTVSKGRFDPTFYFADGNSDRMSVQFTRNSLLSRLDEEIYNSANLEDQRYFEALIHKIETSVPHFYVEYRMTRSIPAEQLLLTGNFGGTIINNGEVISTNSPLSLVANGRAIDLYLDNIPPLGNGPILNIVVPNLDIRASGIGNHDFRGVSSIANYPGYGPISLEVIGTLYAGNQVEFKLTILNNGLTYTLYYNQGFRNVLIPLESRATPAQKQQKAVHLTPEK